MIELFSLGVSLLNLDGSVQVDAQGVPVPTYTQTDVQQLAKALTGWTYSSSKGTPTVRGGQSAVLSRSDDPVEGKHDTSPKTLLGQVIPANQTIQQDLGKVIDIIFNHPNVGPFVATRLIRALVTSNPSPAYITRIATVFNGTSSSARGDMQAVIRAILLDPEARNDSPPGTFGRLRPPMQHTVALARALNLDPGPASKFANRFFDMNEAILDAPSVFAHYSPLFRIPYSRALRAGVSDLFDQRCSQSRQFPVFLDQPVGSDQPGAPAVRADRSKSLGLGVRHRRHAAPRTHVAANAHRDPQCAARPSRQQRTRLGGALPGVVVRRIPGPALMSPMSAFEARITRGGRP